MPQAELPAEIEALYLAARDARDRVDVARARGAQADAGAMAHAAPTDAGAMAHAAPTDAGSPARHAPPDAGALTRAAPPGAGALTRAAATTEAALRAALARLTPDAEAALGPDDRRALAAMRAGIEAALAQEAGLPVAPAVAREACEDPATRAAAIEAGGESLHRLLEGCYGTVAEALTFEGEPVTRPQVLGRLATEPDGAVRRRLFLALEPLWRAVDGDGDEGSPYRAFLRESAARWSSGRSPIAANAAALGVAEADIEAWATATLEAWRTAVAEPDRTRGGAQIEPWDWWWLAGGADRALRAALPLPRLFEVNRSVHASLGADLDALNVRFDTVPRPGRPAVPVAFTTLGARPFRRADGTWSPGEPTVLASYVDGGLGELTELVHETGHAIHVAAIRTRPAFADWPDSDALTEALAELVSLDVAEPAWLARWLPDAPALTAAVALRCRYADVVLDAAWALLEIRLHADPARRPNDVWTEITSRYLGIAPHPEWSWWAMRGQLVQEPGYMANYAIGAVLAADLRAAIRAARGDWTDGDPGWYAWVSERLYRFGLQRPAREVLRDVLGRPPTPEALLAEIARARG